MSQTPPPVAALRADCPPTLAALVMQCLAKDPASRPANATELLHRLDAVASPSGAGAAMPAILIGGRAMLWRALAIYAVSFAFVGIVARAAIIAIGLPDWVFPGSLVVMALGLPVILFTAYTQYVSHRAATATPTFTPGGTQSTAARGTMATLAIKASPHVSWQRTMRGGMIAVGVFVLLVAGFMTMRAMGIGPAGSLLGSRQALRRRQGARRRVRRARRGFIARLDDRRSGAHQSRGEPRSARHDDDRDRRDAGADAAARHCPGGLHHGARNRAAERS